jgi:hypothetical protein
MTPTEILAVAAARGFRVGLNRTGDGLLLWPGDDPPIDLVDLVRGAKPQIVASLHAERGRINHWIANRITEWPPTSCLHCRKPIIVGQLWAVVSNGDVTARFHQDCHSEWLAQHEALARKALGLMGETMRWPATTNSAVSFPAAPGFWETWIHRRGHRRPCRQPYAERRKLLVRDVVEDEARARAFEYAVSAYRACRGVDLEAAKQAVIAAMKWGVTKWWGSSLTGALIRLDSIDCSRSAACIAAARSAGWPDYDPPLDWALSGEAKRIENSVIGTTPACNAAENAEAINAVVEKLGP